MKKVMYHLNDYIVNAENKICRIIGTRLDDSKDPDFPQQFITTLWVEGNGIKHIEEVNSTSVSWLEPTKAMLTKLGFHDREGLGTMVYRDLVTNRSLVIDRTDYSMYGYCSKRHIVLDYMVVEGVHDIQHAFDTMGIDFPCLDHVFFFDNMKRKPPIRLHNSTKNEP